MINVKSCTPAIPLWFPKKWLFGFFILEKQLASQYMFLIKSELLLLCISFLFSINQHLYSHDRFSKNIKPFLCKQKLVNKNIENFVWFPKQYLLVFFILENQLANISDRGFLFLRNTLLLYSLLSFFFSINQHRYNHDRFSKISRSFCGSRNWWIIIDFF